MTNGIQSHRFSEHTERATFATMMLPHFEELRRLMKEFAVACSATTTPTTTSEFTAEKPEIQQEISEEPIRRFHQPCTSFPDFNGLHHLPIEEQNPTLPPKSEIEALKCSVVAAEFEYGTNEGDRATKPHDADEIDVLRAAKRDLEEKLDAVGHQNRSLSSESARLEVLVSQASDEFVPTKIWHHWQHHTKVHLRRRRRSPDLPLRRRLGLLRPPTRAPSPLPKPDLGPGRNNARAWVPPEHVTVHRMLLDPGGKHDIDTSLNVIVVLHSTKLGGTATGFGIRDVRNPEDILAADHLVFPVVNTFSSAMDVLNNTGRADAPREYIRRDRSFLSIRLGLHPEPDEGADFLPASATRLSATDILKLVHNARQLFDGMPHQNLVSWSSAISMYTQRGADDEVVSLFASFRRACDETPNELLLTGVLRVCTQPWALHFGEQGHDIVVQLGPPFRTYVGTTLINLYAESGCMNAAMRLFEALPTKNPVTWAALIPCYSQTGQGGVALELGLEGVQPDMFVLASAVSACSTLGFLEGGRQIHGYTYLGAAEIDALEITALMDLYCKCSRLPIARKLFDCMVNHNLVFWTTMIASYMQNSFDAEAIAMFWQMSRPGWQPDVFAYTSICNSCGSLGKIWQGRQIHAHAANAVLFTFGSYRLRVHGPGADIDTLRVGPSYVNREADFFVTLHAILAEKEDVTELQPVPDAHVPVLKFKLREILIDLLYVRVSISVILADFDISQGSVLCDVDEATVVVKAGPEDNSFVIHHEAAVAVTPQDTLKLEIGSIVLMEDIWPELMIREDKLGAASSIFLCRGEVCPELDSVET